ncbi:MAG: SRPBCC domain-containing protein [Acidimicrobiia bacterium]
MRVAAAASGAGGERLRHSPAGSVNAAAHGLAIERTGGVRAHRGVCPMGQHSLSSNRERLLTRDPAGERPLVGAELGGLGVRLGRGAVELEADHGLVADDPGVVARLDDVSVARPDDDPRRTYVEFTLEPAGAGTRLTVVETGFAQLPDDAYHKGYDSHTEGWARELGELVDYLDAA